MTYELNLSGLASFRDITRISIASGSATTCDAFIRTFTTVGTTTTSGTPSR